MTTRQNDRTDDKSKGTAPTEKLQCYAAVYSHPFGQDVRVFRKETSAKRWRTRIAFEWWDTEFPDDPRPPRSKVGEAYFAKMLERDGDVEYFHIQAAALED
jgi:hypothetical protein